MSILQEALLVRRTLVILIIPILALPILFIDGSREMSCLYGIVIIGVLWITEALPIPVTALLPIVLFPVLGVLPSKQVASSYIKETMIFSFTCLAFALSIERWNLHRRIALACLLLTGSSPKWLTLGFMFPTWFLSMWVNNTSATAMMTPVATAVLKQLGELQRLDQGQSGHSSNKSGRGSLTKSSEELEPIAQDSGEVMQRKASSLQQDRNSSKTDNDAAKDDIEAEHDTFFTSGSPEFRSLCKALSLCVCYAATLGGTASLTGSSTNLIMQGQADTVFGAYHLDSNVTFLSWIMCCFPLSLTCLVIAWIWLVFHFFGLREVLRFSCGDKIATEATRSIVRKELHKLGPFTFAEKAVLGHFVVMLTMWLTMKMPGGYGWATIFPSGFVSNSTTGILIISSLFVFPSKTRNKSTGALEPLMTWEYVQDNLAWGTWVLLGGGFALATSCQKSGLSAWAGAKLTAVSSLEPWLMLFLLSLVISFMTEVASNSATTTILAPVMAQLAINLEVNPLYLLYATALSCSMAFMLPVATPPNAIVFATGYIKIKDMVKAGIVLNILCVSVTCVFINTWFTFLLDLEVLPPEMRQGRADALNLTTVTQAQANGNTAATPAAGLELDPEVSENLTALLV